MVAFNLDSLVISLTDMDTSLQRMNQENTLLKNKLSQLSLEDIELKNIYMRGKKYVEIVELDYIKQGEIYNLKLSRDEFYRISEL